MSEPSLTERLAAPFSAGELKYKAQVLSKDKTRALAVPYVDARCVEDRLDAVFGVEGWQDSYQVLPDKGVICTLRIKVGAEWVEKSDVGSQSDQPDEGDRLKSAFSDALKRAAVKLGIGRYLHRLPQQWVDYDQQTRQLKMPGTPAPAKPANGQQAPAKPATNGKPAPLPRLSEKQWQDVKAALARMNAPQRELLAHFKVKRPSEMLAASYDEALKLAKEPPQAWFRQNGAAAKA